MLSDVNSNASTKLDLTSFSKLNTQTNQQSNLLTQITIERGGRVELTTSDQRGSHIVLRAQPLPAQITNLLEENSSLLKKMTKINQNKLKNDIDSISKLLKDFRDKLELKFLEEAKNDEFYSSIEWKSIVDRIISFGPNRYGPNILVNMDEELSISNVWSLLNLISAEPKSKEYEKNIILGFDLAVSKGPICEEPMQGVALFIEKLKLESTNDLDISMSQLDINNAINTEFENKPSISMGSKTSSFISLMKYVCKRAIEAQPVRLMVAMYKCEAIAVSSEALGKLYAVLGKR